MHPKLVRDVVTAQLYALSNPLKSAAGSMAIVQPAPGILIGMTVNA